MNVSAAYFETMYQDSDDPGRSPPGGTTITNTI
jgi:hypothetical protein